MMFDCLSNTDQIAIWVNDSKLSHPPWLVFENVLTRDAPSGEVGRSKCPVDAVHVRNPDIATRRGFRGTKLAVSEEVKLYCPSGKDEVVTESMNFALEPQPPIKSERVAHGATGQCWNSNVVLLHDVLGVQCRLTVKSRDRDPRHPDEQRDDPEHHGLEVRRETRIDSIPAAAAKLPAPVR
jgi:hypothetical protein